MAEPLPALVVDLDGTLLRGDLLHESALRLVRERPWMLFVLPLWLAQGRAALKARIAERAPIDASTLPYDEAVLARIREARAQGRKLLWLELPLLLYWIRRMWIQAHRRRMGGGPLWASAERVAEDIERALRRGFGTVYTPWWRQLIMGAVRALPERLFVRTRL